MAVNLREKEAAEILTVDGAQVFIGQAGVKKPDHNDLTLIVLNKANSVGAGSVPRAMERRERNRGTMRRSSASPTSPRARSSRA